MKNIIVMTIIIIITIILSPAVFAQTATLSLSPSSGTFNKGCPLTLQINLNTGGTQTDGTDAILAYDSTRFSATSISSGAIYPDYPGNNIDDANGKITVSGLASVTAPFSGQGNLATVNLKVTDTAPSGVTQIKFDFDPNDKSKTTDSNVVERGTISDVLNSVVNGSYTIGTGSCVAAGAPVAPGTGVATPSGAVVQPTPRPFEALPPAGSEQLTLTLAIIGSVLTILGILGLALL